MKFLVALLFSLLSLSGFAKESHSLRLGITRAEVETTIEAPLVPLASSSYKNAFEPQAVTDALRRKLPRSFFGLALKYATFYFDDAGKLARMRVEADALPANDAFKAFVDTTMLLQGDERLKPDEAEHIGKNIDWLVPTIKRCVSEEGVSFALSAKTVNVARSKWKTYTQAQRFALSMACGVDDYVGNLFVDPQHGRHLIAFEQGGPRLTPQNVHAALASPQATVVFLLLQTSAEVPGIQETQELMQKPQ